jgi:predicted O-methyltransferase YrrM
MTTLEDYLKLSEKIPGWTRGEEARALAEAAYALEENAVVVEIGSFFGAGAVILAGARKLRGSGKVHCVDPFDGSGDSFSVPYYQVLLRDFGQSTLRQHFDRNLLESGVSGFVEAHQGTAESVGATWTIPVDMLFFDGDQSPAGVVSAYKAWSPWLKPGGTIALHNSDPREYAKDHDGHYLLAKSTIKAPRYVERRIVGSITFARRAK